MQHVEYELGSLLAAHRKVQSHPHCEINLFPIQGSEITLKPTYITVVDRLAGLSVVMTVKILCLSVLQVS